MKDVTFREPVLGLLSLDFIYIYINRIQTNYPVCRLYHIISIMKCLDYFVFMQLSAMVLHWPNVHGVKELQNSTNFVMLIHKVS